MFSLEEFIESCKHGKCLRNTFISKNCKKEYRQKLCYNKYVQQYIKKETKQREKYIEKGKEYQDYFDKKERGEELIIERNEEWIEFRNKIIERDKDCLVWNILTATEKIYIIRNFGDQLINVSKGILDVAHIISRSQAPHLIYDETNVFLCGRYFHSLLDQYKDLVTRMPIKNNERIKWINRIMQGNEKWKENYSYEDFYKEKIK